jgi:lipopolysaccharide/colanic/teichoic acid biosynthesis glycosyltransferase
MPPISTVESEARPSGGAPFVVLRGPARGVGSSSAREARPHRCGTRLSPGGGVPHLCGPSTRQKCPLTRPNPLDALGTAAALPNWCPATPQSSARLFGYEFCKRLLDVTFGGTLLLLSLPVWVLTAAAVKASGPGPVFYRHRRLGRHGREFWCWKFRTMCTDADQMLDQSPTLRRQFEVDFKLDDDPRVTRIGSFLRRTSIDELPQLLNVVRGEMSLIGPRPIVRQEREKYGGDAGKLLTVPPGLGGIWQAFGRSDTTYAERVRMDITYIDRRSLRMDLFLLFRTAAAVFGKRGAR